MRSPLLVTLALAVAVPVIVALTSLPAAASPARGGLPRLSPTVLPAPEPASVAELDQALKLVTSPKPGDHEAGMARLKDGARRIIRDADFRLRRLSVGRRAHQRRENQRAPKPPKQDRMSHQIFLSTGTIR